MTGDDDVAIDFSILSPLDRADALSLCVWCCQRRVSLGFFFQRSTAKSEYKRLAKNKMRLNREAQNRARTKIWASTEDPRLNRTTGDWHRDAPADRSRVVTPLQRFCQESSQLVSDNGSM
jgi:hypothetical protein